jgi:hypothetical protein
VPQHETQNIPARECVAHSEETVALGDEHPVDSESVVPSRDGFRCTRSARAQHDSYNSVAG